MLITKTVMIKWGYNNKKWYTNKGYKFTKIGDEFKVKCEDLTEGSGEKIDVKCDRCNKIFKNRQWANYKSHIKENGKWHCNKCVMNLWGTEVYKITRLKNGKSFEQWCYDNLDIDYANGILVRWDYKLNKLKPNEINFGTKGRYYFKCPQGIHPSELKSIGSFTRGQKGSMNCIECNTIAETNPELLKYFVNKEDAKKYSYGSNNKINVKCPICGYTKFITISNLRRGGFGCNKCSDGISYPEKFVRLVLEQINLDFKTQLNKNDFRWCDRYKYDIFIPLIGIIEIHGLQHYQDGFQRISKRARTLKEEQENDKLKEKLAKENGIENYIVIDCRKSELEFIKQNILKSDLPRLLNFKEEDINWLKCHEFACSSLVKDACDLWNSGIHNIQKIVSKLKPCENTIRKYLKQGALLGWCDYDSKEETKKGLDLMHEKIMREIICLNTMEKFISIKEASEKYSIPNGNLCICCQGKTSSAGKDIITGEPLIWMYYSNYLKLNKNEVEIAKCYKTNSLKPVINLNTKEIFNSVKEASDKYKIDASSIARVCKGNAKYAGSHIATGEKLVWAYYNDEFELKEYPSTYVKLNGKPVEIFKDNISLNIFENCKDLEDKSQQLFGVKLLGSNISAVCRGVNLQYKGYTFKYIENNQNIIS